MNNFKKIICTVVLLNSFAPAFLVAGQNYNQLTRPLGLHGAPGNRSFNPVPVRPPVYNSKMSPFAIPVDAITESISFAWSAIPTEIKIIGCFAAVLSVPSLYDRFRRWWSSFEDKKDKEEQPVISNVGIVEPAIPLIFEPSVSRRNSLDRRDSFEELFPCSAERARKELALSQPSATSASSIGDCFFKQMEEQKLDRITPGETPGGPDLILRRPVDKTIYDISHLYYNDVLNPTQLNGVVSKVLRQMALYPGLEKSVSFAKGSVAYDIIAGELHEQVRQHSDFEEFIRAKKTLFFERLRKTKGDEVLRSVESVLSKLDGEILDVIDTDFEPAVVRITVPDQAPGLACGAYAIGNMRVMDQLINERTSGNFLEASRSFFASEFGSHPLERAEMNNLAERARAIGIPDMAIAVIDEKSPEVLRDYAGYVVGTKNMSEAIKQLVNRKVTVVHILVSSTGTSEDGDHRQHWSNVGIVFTENMKKPVVVLMDSLKNQWSAKAKPMVQMALRHIAAEVAGAMDSQPSVAPAVEVDHAPSEQSSAAPADQGSDGIGLK